MHSKIYELVGDEFELGYRRQEFWGWKIAFAFFFGEVGAGLFFISAFYNFLLGMVVGWIMVTVFKPAALFMHLGKPLRAWRAIMGLGHSWISRGLLASILFTGFGGIYLLNLYFKILSQPLSTVVFVVAMLACIVVMIYLGFVLSYSPSIPLWESGLMPIISLTYGLLGGVTLVLLFGYQTFLTANPETFKLLKALELGLVIFCAVLLASFLHGAAYASDAGRKSVSCLLKEDLAKWFIPSVILVGMVLTLLLINMAPVSVAVLVAIAVAELIGDVGLKILLFKAAIYQPSLSHSRF
ncbi:MAG: polysulfide reductase NrfD [Deltaproteobacteria bacterium]|jgi:formate-dependent nitrite reductase membrane component NrfD|nr:polysulfide reductase NrfD [Deltaproteobacteria bacterium]